MSKQAEADLILKLFELRRDPKMREARDWFTMEFHPQSAQDYMNTMFSERSAHLRMVTSYWEMAAALVHHGAISLDMFNDTTGEYLVVFSRLEPILAELRQITHPQFMAQVEKLVDATPDGRQRSAAFRERMKMMRAEFQSRMQQKAVGQNS